jgi:hypothetical protein
VQIDAILSEPIDRYAGAEQLWIGLPRISVQPALTGIGSRSQSTDIVATDRTNGVAMIAVMGPDSITLLRALGVVHDQLLNIGSHIEIGIIDEPVRVCRSDFAGEHGYDFVIPIEPFNMILAVICSWAVRLEMNLLRVGWNAVQDTAREVQRHNKCSIAQSAAPRLSERLHLRCFSSNRARLIKRQVCKESWDYTSLR